MKIVHGYSTKRKGNTRRNSFIPQDPTLGCDWIHRQLSIILFICLLFLSRCLCKKIGVQMELEKWNVFVTLSPKHTVSPAYSPTVARECPHIKCTIGCMQGIRMICIRSMNWRMSDRCAIYRGRVAHEVIVIVLMKQTPDPTTHKRLKETHDPCASSWLRPRLARWD